MTQIISCDENQTKLKKVPHINESDLWDGSEKDVRQLSAQAHALELFFSFTWLAARRLNV